MKKYNGWARAFFALLLTFTLIVLGFILFRAGIAYGSSLAVTTAPAAFVPFSTIFLVAIGFILFFITMKLIFGALFFPVMGRRRWHKDHYPPSMRMWKHGMWSEERQDYIKEWHRRLHEEDRENQASGEASA